MPHKRYKDKDKRRKYLRDWRKRNSDKLRPYYVEYNRKLRDRALLIVGRGEIKCIRCGLNEFLEINHKDGNGNEERKLKGGTKNLYQKIVSGRREIEDLELLCRPCHLVTTAEMISGRKYILAHL